MRVANPVENVNKEQICYIGGGTFSSNPLTMTTGYATLEYLSQHRKSVYDKINKLGDMARTGLRKLFSDYGLRTQVTGIGSLFLTHFLTDKINEITNANDVALSDTQGLVRYHFALMAKHGIFFLPRKMGAISTVHDAKDVKNLLNATEKILKSDVLMNIKK
jgi:glutamate-1-semialdehyde 2,1-aminomutase